MLRLELGKVNPEGPVMTKREIKRALAERLRVKVGGKVGLPIGLYGNAVAVLWDNGTTTTVFYYVLRFA